MNATTAVQTNTSPTAFAWIMNCAPDAGIADACPSTQSVTKPGPPRIGRIEDAGHQRAEDAADGVYAEHVERVVGADHLLQARDAPEADDADDQADHERARDADVAGGRRDRHEARDGARRGARASRACP